MGHAGFDKPVKRTVHVGVSLLEGHWVSVILYLADCGYKFGTPRVSIGLLTQLLSRFPSF